MLLKCTPYRPLSQFPVELCQKFNNHINGKLLSRTSLTLVPQRSFNSKNDLHTIRPPTTNNTPFIPAFISCGCLCALLMVYSCTDNFLGAASSARLSHHHLGSYVCSQHIPIPLYRDIIWIHSQSFLAQHHSRQLATSHQPTDIF